MDFDSEELEELDPDMVWGHGMGTWYVDMGTCGSGMSLAGLCLTLVDMCTRTCMYVCLHMSTEIELPCSSGESCLYSFKDLACPAGLPQEHSW